MVLIQTVSQDCPWCPPGLQSSGGLSRTGCCTYKIVHSHGWWLMNQCWLLAGGLGSSHRPLHGAVSDKATGFAQDGGSEERQRDGQRQRENRQRHSCLPYLLTTSDPQWGKKKVNIRFCAVKGGILKNMQRHFKTTARQRVVILNLQMK